MGTPVIKDQFLVPDVVRSLPSPFDGTWCEPRRGSIDRARTRELVEVLDPILAGLEVVPAVDHDVPPIDLFLWPDRGLRLMSRVMPTLSSITLDAVDRRLRELGADLTAKEVERVGQYWVRELLARMRSTIVWTISERASEGRLADHADEYLAVIERRIGGQEPHWGRILVDSIAWDVEEPAIPLLERIAASGSLALMVRQRAAIRLEEISRRREALARIVRERK